MYVCLTMWPYIESRQGLRRQVLVPQGRDPQRTQGAAECARRSAEGALFAAERSADQDETRWSAQVS